MNKRNLLFLFLCLARINNLAAQWSENDSIWLQQVLSGKEELKLNPEFMKAIEEGTLISTDIIQPDKQMKQAPAEMPVAKDFSEYIRSSVKEKPVDPYSIPPSVFWRYGLDIPLPKIYRGFLVYEEAAGNAPKPSGKSFDDGLKYLFSPKERMKMRNRKSAQAWKNYNRFP